MTTVTLNINTEHIERAMSLFSSHASGTTIADIGIANQDALILVLTLELGQPVESGVSRSVKWSEIAGVYLARPGAGYCAVRFSTVYHFPAPQGTVWRWAHLMLIRWRPPGQQGETLRMIARDPGHHDLVARLVAQFPGKKRAAGRSNR